MPAALLVGACDRTNARDISSEVPLLLDADDDGRVDLVCRRPSATGSGEELVALTSPEHEPLLLAVGSVLLWAHDRELRAYERSSGALRWRATLPAELVFEDPRDITRFIVSDDQSVWIPCGDGTGQLVNLEHGALTPADKRPHELHRAPADSPSRWIDHYYPPWSSGSHSRRAACRYAARRLAGDSPRRCTDERSVAITGGTKHEPLIRLVGFTRLSGSVEWHTTLDSRVPADEVLLDMTTADVAVVAFRETEQLDSPLHVRALAVGTGATIWERELRLGRRVTSMVATEDRVYLRVRPNELLVFDARSGEQLRF